jgi:mRNA interferase MazF
MKLRPGEVWIADLGFAARFRPVVIVSREDPDPPFALIIYVSITTQDRDSPYEVKLPRTRFLQEGSVANVQGIASLPTVRLGRRVGTLPAEAVGEIKKAIAWALELELTDGSGDSSGPSNGSP